MLPIHAPKFLAIALTAVLLCTGCQIQLGYPDAATGTSAGAEDTTVLSGSSASSASTTAFPTDTSASAPSVTTAPVLTTTVSPPEPIVPAVKKRVAFTFDDGPHNALTYQFVDKLKEYGASATFFIVGNNINQSRGAAIAYAYENGCEIGMHSFTHTKALYYHVCTDAEYIQDMQKTADAINQYVPAPVTLMRPPGGNITAARVASCPYSVILWNVDSEDWRYKSRTTPEETAANVNAIVENVMRDIDDGDIVLMHEIYENSYEAFCILIERLYAEGYEIVSVTELLGDRLEPGAKYHHA